jgi:ribose transport system substrate-binding protein
MGSRRTQSRDQLVPRRGQIPHRRHALTALAVAGTLALGACGSADSGAQGAGAKVTVPPDKALERQQLPSWLKLPAADTLKDRGNVGEKPSWYTDVKLTPPQIEQVRGKKLKAAFLNWSDGAYNQAILSGARNTLNALGIDLVAVTNYNFDEAKLQENVRNVMALKPDIIFYSGVDPTADKAALKPAVDAGTAVVSFANAPGGWTTGKPSNFVSLVSYPTFQMGEVVAEKVKERYTDGADLGMVYYDANYKLVNEREKGFEAGLQGSNVKIVTKQPMSDPSKTQGIANAMISRDPNLDLVFAPWDQPAEGVVAGLNGAGAKKTDVATIDLGFSGAKSIACGGKVFVESSQLVYEWGRTGAIAAALHALGKPVPPYLVVPVYAVTKENLAEGWDLAFGGLVPLPPEAQKCLDQG